MSSTSLYTLVAGASLVLALWQPGDVDSLLSQRTSSSAQRSETPNQIDRVSQKIDERVNRHKARWENRKAQLRLADGS